MGWQGYQYIAFSWSMFAFATLFVAVRLYVQFRLRIHPWREVLIIVAWVLYLVSTILISLENGWNNFNPTYDAPASDTDAQYDQFWMPVEKAIYANAFTYKPSIYACKAALLLFFADVSPRDIYPKTWWSIRATWVFVIAGAAMQCLMNLFDCWPFGLNWSASNGDCGYRLPLLLTSWSLHWFTDVLVYTIPFIILRNLEKLSKKQRRGAAIMFALGGLNVICATLVLVDYAIPEASADIWAGLDAAMMFTLSFQQATAVIIVCMPQIRRLYQLLYAEKRREAARKHMPSDSKRYGSGTSSRETRDGTFFSKYSSSKTATATTVVGDAEPDLETGEILKENEVKVTKEVRVESTPDPTMSRPNSI